MTIISGILSKLYESQVLGALVFLHIVLCNVNSAPIPSNIICLGEDTPTNQLQPWPSNVIRYTISSNLTVEMGRIILTSMVELERLVCFNVAFVPSQIEEEDDEMEQFVDFVPGNRCCLGRSDRSQSLTVYIQDICVSDGSLGELIGMIIGNTSGEDDDEGNILRGNATGDIDVQRGNNNMTEGGNHTNVTAGGYNDPRPTTECQDTCIKHIIGAVNGRHKRGRIFSPNYPLEYPSNTECVWKITVPDNAALKLNFDDFSTECSYDYLEIHHLTTAEGGIESIGRLCGDLTHQGPITSHLTVDTVILRFYTDVTYNSRGFNISYEIIENRHDCEINNGGCSHKCEIAQNGLGHCVCKPGYRVSKSGACKDINECKRGYHGCEQNCRNLEGSHYCSCDEGYALSLGRLCNRCEEEYNTTQGLIKSGGYPGPYQDEQNCRYTIHIWPEHVLKLTLFVDINPSVNCTIEFLKMDHGFFRHNRRLCGYHTNVIYYIKDNNLTSTSLRFRTRDLNSINELFPSSGFTVNFEQVLRSNVSDLELNTVVIGTNNTVSYQQRPWL